MKIKVIKVLYLRKRGRRLKKTNQLYSVTQLIRPTLNELKTNLLDWLSFVRIVSSPVNYCINKGELQEFDLIAIQAFIHSLVDQKEIQIKINSKTSEFQLSVTEQTIVEQTILDKTTFTEYRTIIEDYFEDRLTQSGIYGYMRSFDEFLFNNTENPKERTFDESDEYKSLPKRYNEEKEIIVDCNQLTGYDLYYNDLCFTSCWRMYYSTHYYQLIPKQIFKEIQQVQAVEELANDWIKITLYNDPFNWDKSVNLSYQRLFRDQLGFDQLTWTNGIGVLREPYIEFIFVDTIIQTIQYQNDQFQPTTKKQATYFVIKSFELKSNSYFENQTKGVLNAQAYFPWIDEKRERMMNYRVLNPKLAIDNGLAAYEFYIRQFLEINVLDEQYNSFLAILRFYLPGASLESLPLDRLYNRLNDTTIKNIKKKEKTTSFDLKKGTNHLQVVFTDYEQLKEKMDIEEIVENRQR